MKKKTLFLLLILILLMLPVQTALADTGPKLSMDFVFKELQDGELQIVQGILYACHQSGCSDAAPLEELGPQRLTCTTTDCHAMAYGFAPYHFLEVEFSDEVTSRSNIFETAGFSSTYTVTVQPDALLVKAQFGLGVVQPYIWVLLVACLCILGVIGLIVWLIVILVGRSKKT